jgi:hypothetical protein
MRIQRNITTISWIPPALLEGWVKLGKAVRIANPDDVPPEDLGDDPTSFVTQLCREGRFRFANHLAVWAEVGDDGTVVDAGFDDTSGGSIGVTTLDLRVGRISLAGVGFPLLRTGPDREGDAVRVTQTFGGRTAFPLPRPVRRPPFVQVSAPTVWTTLEVRFHDDGTSSARMTSASQFPRHWYFEGSELVGKSGTARYKDWAGSSFGTRTPWGDEASPALVSQVETRLERALSATIMRGDRAPEQRKLRAGDVLCRQGEQATEVYVVLDGLLEVHVDDTLLVVLGPGSVIGERALLEGGRRTSTVRASTACVIAVAEADAVDRDKLLQLSSLHRREEERGASADGDV